VLVTETFRNARAAAAGAAKLGSPGLLWWRAQLRRRNAAVERIGRPLLSAQIFALATILLLTVGFVVSQARHGLGWLTWKGFLRLGLCIWETFGPRRSSIQAGAHWCWFPQWPRWCCWVAQWFTWCPKSNRDNTIEQ